MSKEKKAQEKILKIRSERYPNNVQEVSEETWEIMKSKGMDSKFVVIDKITKPSPIPLEVTETVKSKPSK